jgi:hypothetical protein
MSFFANLKTSWKSMSRKKKLQMVICGVCDIGADLLAGLALGKLVPKETPKWKKAAMIFTAGGLGMAAGDLASKQLNDTLDLIWKDNEEDGDE